MLDQLADAKRTLARFFTSDLDLDLQPVSADRWVVASCLQKAIRRGEAALARRAALTLLHLPDANVWQRLIVIAAEDVGIGDVAAVACTVAVCTDVEFRRCQGKARVAAALAQMLAEAAKDRSTDYLASLSANGPRSTDTSDDDVGNLVRQAASAVQLSGLVAGRWSLDREGLALVLQGYRDHGAPAALLAAAEVTAIKTREAIAVLLPLIWLAHDTASAHSAVIPTPREAAECSHGVPLYTLDMHTRLGRTAIARWASEVPAVRKRLDGLAKPRKRLRAAYNLAFYTDAYLTAPKLVWGLSGPLEGAGIDCDLAAAGFAVEAIPEALEAARAALPQLQAIRKDVLSAQGERDPRINSGGWGGDR